MQRHLLRALLVAAAAVAVWSAFALVGGTPGFLYAAGTILLTGVLFQRLGPVRDPEAPLPARPWNRKARRIQELESQVAHAISELAARAQTIDQLRGQVREQASEHDALQKTMQMQLAALQTRLRSHEAELMSFERQLGTAPLAAEPWAVTRA